MPALRAQLAAVSVAVLCGSSAWAQAPGFWRVSTIDSQVPNLMSGTLAFFEDGRPAAAYAPTSNQPYLLGYAEYNGSTWVVSGPQTLGQVWRVMMAIRGTTPAWVYPANSSLVYQDPQGWTVLGTMTGLTLLGVAFEPQTGWPAVLVSDRQGSYPTTATLWYYFFDGATWQHEAVDSLSASNGGCGFNSGGLVFLPAGVPAIAYVGSRSELSSEWSDVKQRTRQSPGNWSDETIESAHASQGFGTTVNAASIAVRPSGEPVVSYIRNHWGGPPAELQFWPPLTPVYTLGGNAEMSTSVAVLPTGTPAIAHVADDTLRYSWNSGTAWQTADVTTGVTALLSMAVSPTTGQPAIAFWDQSFGSVKYAVAFLRGDLNCDGLIDFNDVNPFVLALTDPAGYAAAYPECNIIDGDINEDGQVNFDDINPFVALLSR